MLFNSSAHPLCTGHAIKITLSTSIPTTLETYYSVTLNCMNRYESAQQHGLTLSCRQGVLVTGVQMPRCTLGSWRQSLSWGADKWASMGMSSNAANFRTNSLCWNLCWNLCLICEGTSLIFNPDDLRTQVSNILIPINRAWDAGEWNISLVRKILSTLLIAILRQQQCFVYFPSSLLSA